eukprot:CAMPEP_0119062832 /NCGR_PEP_ID=MMETSP1178-20130426/6331_1 /TAXON_ID=33656 /ORGANISM="unid sp, Strain CCMP2000" /LENGTH=117 /DNA_ID=CAMNT_0007044139 /DNA_START=43 /DNA_END=397 /DNA_ORIENTATION=-
MARWEAGLAPNKRLARDARTRSKERRVPLDVVVLEPPKALAAVSQHDSACAEGGGVEPTRTSAAAELQHTGTSHVGCVLTQPATKRRGSGPHSATHRGEVGRARGVGVLLEQARAIA